MPSILILPKEGDEPFRLVYGVPADWLAFGEWLDPETAKVYPTISICYPREAQDDAVRIFEEMMRLEQFPTVFLRREAGKVYVAVLFRLKNASRSMLRGLIYRHVPHGLRHHFPEALLPKVEVIMTGEAEFAEALAESFFANYEQVGVFHVRITQSMRGPLLGAVQLNSFSEEWPTSYPA